MKITNKILKREDLRFLFATGFKFAAIFLLISLFVYYLIWVVLVMNSIFFESKGLGLSMQVRDAFLDHIFRSMGDRVMVYVAFVISLFFGGMYFGKILLRPFEVIGQYSLDKAEDKASEYNPDLFSDYKLLTRFSEFFFRYIDESMKRKQLYQATIPPSFSKIRQPPFERVFFFHFLLLILIFTITTISAMIFITSEFREQIMELSIKILSIEDGSVPYFLKNQEVVFESVIGISMVLIITSYLALAFHLYGKVSGAIFAFFSTMRSFMRGNTAARVHLIGFAQIRPHGRSFNKYLDKVARACLNEENKED